MIPVATSVIGISTPAVQPVRDSEDSEVVEEPSGSDVIVILRIPFGLAVGRRCLCPPRTAIAAGRTQRPSAAAPLRRAPHAGASVIASRFDVEHSPVIVAQLMLTKPGQRHMETGCARFVTLDDRKRPP